ncbi:MAG TPA: hypothetical protein VNW53_14910 [Phenylobacterium sp.]|jgi:hypothetical protein|uniref:hypothetical protein n=1 Tax=Phenylobacterium sp. TaxID=1871053 RepID=UPI002B8A8B43|nr:hypothetical protein [Phenylobacterium sp.]HXA40287.1 hypothetical protein [Phenylobacterium sp.]
MSESSRPQEDQFAASIRRRVRLVVLLKASLDAGIDPLPALRLHLIAYLANVLSPVWDMPSVDGTVLKRSGGPFYPDLQRDLDRLVGLGVARVEGLKHVEIDAEHYRLEGSYRLNPDLADPILGHLETMPDEAASAHFLRELVLALSALSDAEIDRVINEDATYADPHFSADNVIDFGEWLDVNYSAASAEKVGSLVETGAVVGASEKVHLYVRHLRRRLQGAR